MSSETLLKVSTSSIREANKALEEFAEANTSVFIFDELEEGDFRAQLWQQLFEVLGNESKKQLHFNCLRVIRILSRDKRELNALLTNERVNLLLSLACPKNDTNSIADNASSNEDNDSNESTGDNKDAGNKNYEVISEALKALCNIIYNSSSVAVMCSENHCLADIVTQLKNDTLLSIPIVTYSLRILFVVSALHSKAREIIKNKFDGIKFFIELLFEVCEPFYDDPMNKNMRVDLICEGLKLLFNLTIRLDYGDKIDYSKLFVLLRYLLNLEIHLILKRNELTNQVVNLLTTLPNDKFHYLIYPSNKDSEEKEDEIDTERMKAIDEMLRHLRTQLDKMKEDSPHDMLSPILTALLKASRGDHEIRKYIRKTVLPPLTDVHSPPEEGETYRNYLCRLLTSPVTGVRNLAADLLFVLCKENVNRMIKYTGYGNAAGMLARFGLMGGGMPNRKTEGTYSSDSDSDTEEYKQHKHGINPVTGYFEPARPNPTAHMTDEQKEYEAMKLVSLINDLNNMGVIKPCQVGEDGKPKPIEHVLQLHESVSVQEEFFDGRED